ncbi:Trypanosomal VSG domain [Trypanosoma vivax]|nr:hypothetical protein TRVL_01993 [Trypanosoma vivax]KAH8609827.1 Trypanosomal VSG domain [Trypanosoma vivax]
MREKPDWTQCPCINSGLKKTKTTAEHKSKWKGLLVTGGASGAQLADNWHIAKEVCGTVWRQVSMQNNTATDIEQALTQLKRAVRSRVHSTAASKSLCYGKDNGESDGCNGESMNDGSNCVCYGSDKVKTFKQISFVESARKAWTLLQQLTLLAHSAMTAAHRETALLALISDMEAHDKGQTGEETTDTTPGNATTGEHTAMRSLRKSRATTKEQECTAAGRKWDTTKQTCTAGGALAEKNTPPLGDSVADAVRRKQQTHHGFALAALATRIAHACTQLTG